MVEIGSSVYEKVIVEVNDNGKLWWQTKTTDVQLTPAIAHMTQSDNCAKNESSFIIVKKNPYKRQLNESRLQWNK